MKIITFLFGLLLILLSVPLISTEAVILYDGSSSMKGFARLGSLASLDSKLTHAISKAGMHGERVFFRAANPKGECSIDSLTNSSELNNADSFNGRYTLLDNAIIQTKHKYKSIILVTDNVYADGTYNTDKFYQEIAALCYNMNIPIYKVTIKYISLNERSIEIYE